MGTPADVKLRFDNDGFWDKYRKGRPTVPDSFFDRIYEYHKQHGGSFDVVHDAGAGPGIHSARLAAKFNHVMLSDPSELSIDGAKARLGEKPPYEYRIAKFEDVEGLKENSMDVITGFNMIHFAKFEPAMKAAAFQLKPGGTLALATFCYPVLDNKEAQKIVEEIFQRGAEALMAERSELASKERQLGRATLASDFDIVPVPAEYFEPGVKRLKLNYAPGFSYFNLLIPPQHSALYKFPSAIGADDQCENLQDDSWKISRNVNGWKELFASHPLERAEVDDLWSKLEGIVGDNQLTGRWAVHMILATKK